MFILKRTFAIAAILAIFLSGCTSAPATTGTAAPISLTDGTGTRITLPGPAQRIVSLGPSNTEILFSVGARDQIVGCDDSSDYPEAAKALATISAGYGTLNVEAITALEPDLVLAAEIISPEQVETMRSLGLKVFYLANPTSLPDGLFANIRAVGTLTGRTPEAEKLISGLQSRFNAVQGKAARAASSPLVYFELDATDPSRPYVAGPGSFIDMLIRIAGGKNLGAALSTSWAQISAEEILHQDPDIILLGDTGFGVTPESVAGRPGWKNLKAVNHGTMYAIDSNLVLRPGPRLADALEIMARRIHPEIFGTG
jgi:iron complex transport system substrate-binding protein